MRKKYNLDYLLIFYISILLFIKIILISHNLKLLYKSLINIILGFILMYILSKINYKFYEKISYLLYILNIILMLFTIFFGKKCKGASRWISFGIFNFQVSEFFKVIVPMILSSLIYRSNDINSFKNIFIYILIIFIPVLLVILQPDLGTSILIFFSGFSTLFFSGINFKKIFLIKFIFLKSILIYLTFFIKKYQKNRILSFLNLENNILENGYHIDQSKIAIGSGGLFGKGIFNGTQSRLNFIPEVYTDFIFSVFAEEFGLLGVLLLLIVYLLLIIRCINFAFISRNIFKKILISSFMFSIFISTFINIGMVTGLLPIVGIPLPFISYGGSSLIILLIKIGIIISMKNNNENLYF